MKFDFSMNKQKIEITNHTINYLSLSMVGPTLPQPSIFLLGQGGGGGVDTLPHFLEEGGHYSTLLAPIMGFTLFFVLLGKSNSCEILYGYW